MCDVRLQYNINHVVSKSQEGELTFTSQWRPAVKFKQGKTHAHKINYTRTIWPKEKENSNEIKLYNIIYNYNTSTYIRMCEFHYICYLLWDAVLDEMS